MTSGTARVLSNVLLAVGTGLTVFPLLWVGYTALQVGPVQEAALASWDDPIPAASAGPTAQSIAASPPTGLLLTIPRLGLKRFVPEGASLDRLRRYGVGRITWTPMPDQAGIVGIAGHRTTYGAPFFRLDRLKRGDRILIDHAGTRFMYSVTDRVTVRPHQVDVLRGSPGQRGVALVTCAPVYSAAYRLVILGSLEEMSPIAIDRVN